MIGLTDIKDIEAIELDQKYGAHHYTRLETVIRKTAGAWLYTQDGRKMLDCLAAYSAANPGHHHPKIVNALMSALQGNYGSVISNVVYTDPLGLFLSKMAKFVPQLAPRFGQEMFHGFSFLVLVGAEAFGQQVEINLVAVEIRTVHTGEFGLAAD